MPCHPTSDAAGDPSRRVIRLHAAAPPKPRHGNACNGCGVCCAMEPCPLGMLASRRLDGACTALTWVPARQDGDRPDDGASPAAGAYRCGLVMDAAGLMPRWLRPAAPWVARAARRMIAAGQGCDCDVEVAAAPP